MIWPNIKSGLVLLIISGIVLFTCNPVIGEATKERFGPDMPKSVQFGPKSWFTLDNNLSDYLNMSHTADKLLLLIYHDKKCSITSRSRHY
ncbi:hypothetical protein JXQ70_03310 [bacterium]|nr:hypothetical protein [bacterium]